VDPKRTPPRGGIGPLQPPGKGPSGAVSPGPSRPQGAGPSPAAQSRVQEALDQLARDIQQMRIEFERYFSGGLPIPPEEIRNRVQAQFRQLRGMTLNGAADGFRLGSLEAQYNTYNELFNRRLRDREEGRGKAAHRPVVAEKPRYDPMGGITFGSRIESEAAEALYRGLASGGGEVRFDLDSFQTYLARQVESIRQKTGCEQVQFRLAEEEGKLKLKAKPVPGR
jgi:hypothetical protein